MKIIKRFVFLFIAIFILHSLIKNIISFQEKYQFYLSIKDQYEKLKKKNIELKTQLLRKKDPAEIEKKAREKLNLGLKNEMVVILPPISPTPLFITPTPKPIWQQWLEIYIK